MPITLKQVAQAAAGALLAAAPAVAQDTASFYKGKTIRLIVAFTPGGGADANARLIARYYGRNISGNPNIVVENMPGAASLKAVQYLDDAAKDGTVIVAPSSGLITQSMTSPEKFPVRMTNYAWLGSASEEVRACYAWSATGIRTWDDMKKAKEVVFGETGAGSSGYINRRMLGAVYGIKVKQVLGYPGAAEKHLAMERGEVDADCGTFGDVSEDWIQGKKINVILRLSTHLMPGIPADAPYFLDLINDVEKKQTVKLLTVPAEIGRPYIVSKAVPADRLEALRAAFDRMVADPAFVADAQKQRLTVIGPMTGAAVQDYVAEMYKSPQDVIADAKAISGD